MEGGRIRIVDIAEELGVSTATVSNVIHGKTKKISDETCSSFWKRNNTFQVWQGCCWHKMILKSSG